MVLINSIIKKQLGIIFRILPNIRRVMKQGLTIFIFHEVSNLPSQFAEEYGLSVSIKTFNRQMTWIRSNFNIIHPIDVINETHLPERAAIISFDDGFFSSFENGLVILEKLRVPSIVFLNMQAIIEQKPILSAIACFLNRYVPEFSVFSKSVGLSPPFHLTLSPSILRSFEKYYGPIDVDAVLDYQGRFADLRIISSWNKRDLVVYGNHLFDHWNASALSNEEFKKQYKMNESALSRLENSINFFSFTNGKPGTCFSVREVDFLKQWGVVKAFSGLDVINSDAKKKFLLGRISLSDFDNDENQLWFRIGRAVYNGLLQNKN